MYPDAGAAPSGATAGFFPALAASEDRTEALLTLLIRGAVVVALLAMTAMAFTRNVNWDEFYFLSHVHAHLDGTLTRPLQTFFVHGFGWLPLTGAQEIDQITTARLVMMLFFLGTCLSLHRVAQTLADTRAADLAVLAFVTSGFAIAHGGSFRADPMAASLLMGAVALLMTTRMGALQVVAAALMSALAVLITVKSVLFAPVLLGALLWRWDDKGVMLRGVFAGALALLFTAALYIWHAAGLSPAEGETTSSTLNSAARVTLGGSGLMPRWPETSLWLMLSAGPLLLAVAGYLIAPTRKLFVVLILFAAPLLAVVIYRNAFPYYFPFAVPAFMAAAAVGARAFRGSLVWKLALVLMLASGSLQTMRALGEGNAAQRDTIAEVHRLFPAPVPYIDQNGMVSSFPRPGFFMSTWGMAKYRAAGIPVFADLIETHRPPLLVANRHALFAAMWPQAAQDGLIGLLPEDARALRAAYIHHAGAIWIAGRHVTLDAEGRATARLPFPGRYRVEAVAPVTIDGKPVGNGAVVTLDRTDIRITGPAGDDLRLVWDTPTGSVARHLPQTGLYAGFWRL